MATNEQNSTTPKEERVRDALKLEVDLHKQFITVFAAAPAFLATVLGAFFKDEILDDFRTSPLHWGLCQWVAYIALFLGFTILFGGIFAAARYIDNAIRKVGDPEVDTPFKHQRYARMYFPVLLILAFVAFALFALVVPSR